MGSSCSTSSNAGNNTVHTQAVPTEVISTNINPPQMNSVQPATGTDESDAHGTMPTELGGQQSNPALLKAVRRHHNDEKAHRHDDAPAASSPTAIILQPPAAQAAAVTVSSPGVTQAGVVPPVSSLPSTGCYSKGPFPSTPTAWDPDSAIDKNDDDSTAGSSVMPWEIPSLSPNSPDWTWNLVSNTPVPLYITHFHGTYLVDPDPSFKTLPNLPDSVNMITGNQGTQWGVNIPLQLADAPEDQTAWVARISAAESSSGGVSHSIKWGICVAPGATVTSSDGSTTSWVSSCQSVFINGEQTNLYPYLWFPYTPPPEASPKPFDGWESCFDQDGNFDGFCYCKDGDNGNGIVCDYNHSMAIVTTKPGEELTIACLTNDLLTGCCALRIAILEVDGVSTQQFNASNGQYYHSGLTDDLTSTLLKTVQTNIHDAYHGYPIPSLKSKLEQRMAAKRAARKDTHHASDAADELSGLTAVGTLPLFHAWGYVDLDMALPMVHTLSSGQRPDVLAKGVTVVNGTDVGEFTQSAFSSLLSGSVSSQAATAIGATPNALGYIPIPGQTGAFLIPHGAGSRCGNVILITLHETVDGKPDVVGAVTNVINTASATAPPDSATGAGLANGPGPVAEGKVAKRIKRAIVSAAKTLAKDVKQAAQTVANDNVVKDVAHAIKEGCQDLGGLIKQGVTTLVHKIETIPLINGIILKITTIAGDIKNFVVKAAHEIGNFVKKMVSDIKDVWNNVKNWLKFNLDFADFKLTSAWIQSTFNALVEMPTFHKAMGSASTMFGNNFVGMLGTVGMSKYIGAAAPTKRPTPIKTIISKAESLLKKVLGPILHIAELVLKLITKHGFMDQFSTPNFELSKLSASTQSTLNSFNQTMNGLIRPGFIDANFGPDSFTTAKMIKKEGYNGPTLKGFYNGQVGTLLSAFDMNSFLGSLGPLAAITSELSTGPLKSAMNKEVVIGAKNVLVKLILKIINKESGGKGDGIDLGTLLSCTSFLVAMPVTIIFKAAQGQAAWDNFAKSKPLTESDWNFEDFATCCSNFNPQDPSAAFNAVLLNHGMHADSTIAAGTAVAAAGPVSEGSSGASWVDENENAVVMIEIMGAMFSVACGVCTECALAVPAVDAAMNNGFAFPALMVFLNMMSNTAAILSVGVTVRQHRTQGTSLDTGVVIMGSYFMFATLVSSIVMGVNGFKKDITKTKYVNIPSLLMSIIGFGCTAAAYHIDRPNFSMEDDLQAWRIDVSEYVFDFLAGFVSSFNIPDAEAELQVAQLAIYAALEMTYLGLDFTSIWK